jgi:2'-5' RNA ligase/8-oxo-dGTP pyrophosphatase MutT (NUDIX family)
VGRRRLAVVALLPQPVALHVQAWRRALREPTRDAVPPHITLVPPQSVRAEEVPAAVALLERAAAEAVPGVVTLEGSGTFLPESPVAFIAVGEGVPLLASLEARLREPPLHRRTHPFHPHVTVAQDLPPEEIEQAARDLAGFRASFPLHEVALMEEGDGRVWRPLRRVAVGASELVREVPVDQAASVALFLLDPPLILLGLRTRDQGRRYPGAWDALGGKPEPGEALLEALLREVGEEAAVEPLEAALLGCFDDGERADAFYVATSWRGEPHNNAPDEHVRLEWVAIDEALGRNTPPTVRRALARLIEVVGGAGTVHGTPLP